MLTVYQIYLLVDWNVDCVEEHPLADVVVVHTNEEDDDEHHQHPPEFPASPLGQSQLRHELATHILKLLIGSTGHTTFLRKRRSAIGQKNLVLILWQNILLKSIK